MIFPILAIYRQYVELSLKEVIAYGEYLEGKNPGPLGHNLDELWADAKKYICTYCDALKQTDIDRIEQLVYEIHALDPTSQSTHYPFVKRKSKPKLQIETSFPDGPDFIDLDSLHKHIDELGQLFDQVTHWLAIMKDQEAEQRSIYRSEFY